MHALGKAGGENTEETVAGSVAGGVCAIHLLPMAGGGQLAEEGRGLARIAVAGQVIGPEGVDGDENDGARVEGKPRWVVASGEEIGGDFIWRNLASH